MEQDIKINQCFTLTFVQQRLDRLGGGGGGVSHKGNILRWNEVSDRDTYHHHRLIDICNTLGNTLFKTGARNRR
jgi:hypothetical protein